MIPFPEQLKIWRRDPVQFVRDQFKVEPDKWQVNALMAFASGDNDKYRISLQACAGPGKSAVLAWIAWNFLLCYAEVGEHPKGAAISVSWDNLKDNLWVEIAKWQGRSVLLLELFQWTQRRIYCKEFPKTWFLSARSYPANADTETLGRTLSGVHGKYVIFLIDESGDIPPQVGKAAEQAMGETIARGGVCKIIQAGNPISIEGLLYSASKDPDWYVIRITGDPDDEDRSPRIDKAWAAKQIEKEGRDNPWVMSYILGRFPRSSINTLLSVDQVEDAMSRNPSISEYAFAQKRIGVDVATTGLDSTVLFPRQGLAAFMYSEMRNADGPQISARIQLAKTKWGQEMEFIDNTGGFGGSVIDNLKLAGFSPTGVHFASSAIDSRYFNRRSEMWLEMAEWVKRGGALPRCQKLKKELTSVTYYMDKGKLRLEEKAQVKKRLQFSPDRADALALTFALPDQPAKGPYEYLKQNDKPLKSEWDPFK